MKKFLVGLIVFIIILISILIQINLLNVVTLAGTAANIGIVLAIGIGLMCDKISGSMIGIIYGFIQDILFGKAIGVYSLIYMLIGFFSGKLGKSFSRDNKTTMVSMVGVGTVVFKIIFFVFAKIFYNYDLYIMAFIFDLIKEIIYNMIIAIILFKPISLLAEIINKSKNNYYLL